MSSLLMDKVPASSMSVPYAANTMRKHARAQVLTARPPTASSNERDAHPMPAGDLMHLVLHRTRVGIDVDGQHTRQPQLSSGAATTLSGGSRGATRRAASATHFRRPEPHHHQGTPGSEGRPATESASPGFVAIPGAIALWITDLRRPPGVEGWVGGPANSGERLAAIIVRGTAARETMCRPPMQQAAAIRVPAADGA